MPPNVMEIRLRSVQQLFNSMDPSPFVDRDLDADAEEYIVSWARELPRGQDFRLVLHLEEFPQDPGTAHRVEEAVRHYFGYRAQVASREFNHLMREGRLSLFIGLVFLALCLLGSRALSAVTGAQPGLEFVSEGLVIGGWVAMWRPMEIFLYAWWPLARRRAILRRLAEMSIQLQKAKG